MSLINKLLKVFILTLCVCSCMPMKSYYAMENANKKFVSQNKSDSTRIDKLTTVNGEQLMKLMSLSKDSIRMNHSFDSLLVLHEKQSYMGYMQIANIKRALDNKNMEVAQVGQKSQAIIYSFKSFDIESNSIYRQLKSTIQKYATQGVLVNKSYWNVTVKLPDNLLFENGDIKKLSNNGMDIIRTIISTVNQFPKYHIDITEYSKPYSRTIATQKVNTKTIIDTLQHHTVDSLGVKNGVVDIEYSYEGFDIINDNIIVNYPAGMNRGTSIINYIETLNNYKDISYSGSIITNMPAEKDTLDCKQTIEIIINPKTSSLLRDIGSF